LERAAAARADGFTEVESWWDFDNAAPDHEEMEAYIRTLKEQSLKLIAINSYGGNRRIGETGIASLPDRADEFRKSIASVKRVFALTGARKSNVAFGVRDLRWSQAEQLETGRLQYDWAARDMAELGATILIEPLSGMKDGSYPFVDGYDVRDFIEHDLGKPTNVKLLFDTYHLAVAGLDVVKAWSDLHDVVGHVQFADFPGRGAPGSGRLDFAALEAAMASDGYEGKAVLEYM
jgi:hydroxypyruvate isomerase